MPPLALTPTPGTDGGGHQLDRVHRGAAAGVKSGGGLDEVRARVGGDPAADASASSPARLSKRRRLDDHLEDGVGNGGADCGDIGPHSVEITGHGGADVDDHVDLVGARGDRLRGLGGLDRRKMFA